MGKDQIERSVDVARAFYGPLIGKGGAQLKAFQEEFGVRIRIPQEGAVGPVKLIGAKKRCEACEAAIWLLVEKHSRKAETAKPSKPRRLAGKFPFPEKCCCGAQLASLTVALEHLRSGKHVTKVEEELGTRFLGDAGERCLTLAQLMTMLGTPEAQQLHRQWGYETGKLLEAIPREQERLRRKEQKEQELRVEIVRLPADPEWLNVESRLVLHWDDSPGTVKMGLQQAPPLADMIGRLNFGRSPPTAIVPKLPAALPRVDPKQRKRNAEVGSHKYPAEPASGRLGIAVIQAQSWHLSAYRFVCGTSFIKALAGDVQRTKDVFHLQRVGSTTVVLHDPQTFHNQDDAGHAVERLLCRGDPQHFAAATTLSIDGLMFMVTSEVDAADINGELQEIKSSKHADGMSFSKEIALQVSVNGSKSILACLLDSDRTRAIRTETTSVEDVRERYEEALTAMGRRVRLLLRRVLATVEGRNEDGALKMTFDECRLPIFDDSNVQVLPVGLA
mmetsp:Transcript_42322/g.78831  ORF Transcript_42322/g.78831 Transcript_42322/m.78831 type:complete len:503 (+) Transcript_42322:78-1586(+)